jgi:hypothetical protein
MSTLHGACLPTDPWQMPVAAELAPFRVVRLVASATPEFSAAVRDYQSHGLVVAVVMDHDTLGDDPVGWTWACDDLVRRCRPDLLVLGNEMDNLAPSVTSWTMPPAKYAQLWSVCEPALRNRWPEARLCIGGQVSGLPERALEYVTAVARAGGHPDSIDVHPYAKGPADAGALLAMYREALPQLQLEVLEWTQEPDDIPAFVRALERVGAELACYFAWHSVVEPRPEGDYVVLGLHDLEGRPTDRYQRYVQALSGPVIPKEGTNMPDAPEFVLGFQAYAEAHPEVGVPVENEHSFGGSYNAQMTTAGLLVYSVEANQVIFLPKA